MAGRLRHKVTIERQTTSTDAVGQRVRTWTEVDSTWSSIRPVKGRDFFAASGERAEITHEILVRYGADVAVGDRVKYGARYLDVRSVLNVDERDRFYVIMAVEHAD